MVETFIGARTIILENVVPLEPEAVKLIDLIGRVLAEEIRAPWDLPRWDNSEMDGFAVRTIDCQPFARREEIDKALLEHFVPLLCLGLLRSGELVEILRQKDFIVRIVEHDRVELFEIIRLKQHVIVGDHHLERPGLAGHDIEALAP